MPAILRQPKRRHKYAATPMILTPNGGLYRADECIRFDSKHEADMYSYLVALQMSGEIRNLRNCHQHRDECTFIVGEIGGKKIKYVCDFTYEEKVIGSDGVGWVRRVADAKGMRTRDYLRKKAAMKERYGIEVVEL